VAVAPVGQCRASGQMTGREVRILAVVGLLIAVVSAGLVLLVTTKVLFSPDVSRVEIIYPPQGFLTVEGEGVTVQGSATGRYLVKSELWVDGALVEQTTSDSPGGVGNWSVSHSWRPEELGQHQLALTVYSRSGSMLTSAARAVGVVPRGRIAFASNRDGSYDIYTMRTDGREVTRLTDGPERDREPSCSGAGLMLYTSSAVEGGTDIWLMVLESNETRNLTRALGGDYSPRWAPDGDTIAFVSDRHGPGQLYLMEADGSGQAQLSRQESSVEQPSWAPDGLGLLFASEQDGSWELFNISVEDASTSRLTEDAAQDWYPAWSPTGDHIAFTSDRGGRHQIYVMEPDGTEARRLTMFPLGAEQPQWSPDGQWIVFIAYTGRGEGLSAREIYIMGSDGGDPMRLTDNAFDDTDPVWCR
jgi:Tol biopolymer transport system component